VDAVHAALADPEPAARQEAHRHRLSQIPDAAREENNDIVEQIIDEHLRSHANEATEECLTYMNSALTCIMDQRTCNNGGPR
jgi:hypothetical protein